MFKIQIEWKLANGKSYEEWTIPWEIAQAEKETNTTFLELFKRELPPSLEQQFWLAYQMQKILVWRDSIWLIVSSMKHDHCVVYCMP
jgi:hypothetical protein